jgi:hypothetical protein
MNDGLIPRGREAAIYSDCQENFDRGEKNPSMMPAETAGMYRLPGINSLTDRFLHYNVSCCDHVTWMARDVRIQIIARQK